MKFSEILHQVNILMLKKCTIKLVDDEKLHQNFQSRYLIVCFFFVSSTLLNFYTSILIKIWLVSTTLLLISLSLSQTSLSCKEDHISSKHVTKWYQSRWWSDFNTLTLFFSLIFNSLHPSKFYLIFYFKT